MTPLGDGMSPLISGVCVCVCACERVCACTDQERGCFHVVLFPVLAGVIEAPGHAYLLTRVEASLVAASGPYADLALLGADISCFVAPQCISGLQMRVS